LFPDIMARMQTSMQAKGRATRRPDVPGFGCGIDRGFMAASLFDACAVRTRYHRRAANTAAAGLKHA
jgi:hypothetical protein